jgi:flagellin
MSISILNNPASLAAQNQLGVTNASLQKTLYQLSSGSRINTGADDAAGLAVANGLMANITALTQSARNANDGVGKLQVADGALAQVTTLLNRAVTLATESANGTLSDAQRAPLQAEFASIAKEIDRIGATTNFNGQQVFQNVNANTVIGSATGVNASTSLGGSPLTSIAGTAGLTAASNALTAAHGGTWTSTAATLTQATSIAGETINITVTTPGTGTAASYSYIAGTTGAATVAGLMGYINAQSGLTATGAAGAGSAMVLTANGAAVTLSEVGGAAIGAGTQNGAQTASTFTIGTSNPYTYSTYGVGSGATLGTLVGAINSDARYSASISAGGNLTIGYGTVTEPAGTGTAPAIAEGATGTWSFGTAGAFTTGGATKTFTIQPFGAPTSTTFYDQGNMTVGTLMSDLQSMGLSATLNGNGSLVVADPNNPNNAPTITTPAGATTAFGTFAAGSAQASVAAATDLYLTDDSANAANTIAVTIGSLSSSNMNGASIASDNLSTQGTAQAALTDISTAINDVAALRGTLGASVNRLQSATNVINNNIQNLTSAQDQIMAADIPSTVASMSKYSILEQTGVAALSQANQMQQLVLKLIQ